MYWIGIVIASLNVISVANSTYFFLGMVKVSVKDWLCLNACAPSTMIYLLGYFTGSYVLMSTAIPLLAFFGVGGMFFFSWKGHDIFAQIGHILMASAILWVVVEIYLNQRYESAFFGFLLGAFLDTNAIGQHQQYYFEHKKRLTELMRDPFKRNQKKESS